jgi:hypothetical protein
MITSMTDFDISWLKNSHLRLWQFQMRPRAMKTNLLLSGADSFPFIETCLTLVSENLLLPLLFGLKSLHVLGLLGLLGLVALQDTDITLGRSKECSYSILGKKISSVHCKITKVCGFSFLDFPLCTL